LGHPDVWGAAGDRLMIVGLTGGIASGKSEVDRELERLGAPVIDADEVARCVVLPGMPALKTLVEHLGDGILDDSGNLDRPALAEIIFNDASRRMLVNSITHPAIFQEMSRRVTRYAEEKSEDDVPVVVLDAALIVDTGVTGVFDMLIVVTADEETRLRRLVEERAMPVDEARARISSQFGDAKRLELADIVIENNGSLEELRGHVRRVFDQVSEKARQSYS
jgi:dephospho-CoA kinase